jgi:class 3 adenylate cyclase
MTLVERFIAISNWPASRRTVLWTGYLIIAQLLVWSLAHFALTTFEPRIVDVSLFDRLLLAWSAVLVLILLVSLPSAIAGREARWTAYVLVAFYSFFTLMLIHLFGSVSSPHMALVVLVTLVAAGFWDVRIGIFAFSYLFFLFGILWFLEASGRLSYAPLILDRTLDAQRHHGLFIVTYGTYFIATLACFVTIGLVISARRLQENRLNQAQKLIRRYVPSQVADAIISGREEMAEKHERRKLTIFFSDLVGFTDIAEELEPEDLSRVLNEYFSAMTAIAQKHGGTVDELSGDAILVFFGAPYSTDDKDHALKAVHMAMDMQQAMSILNAKWRGAGITEPLQVRMGINTGVVTVGNFGSPERMKYAVLGKHVNLAARIQSQCEPGRVLLSHATWLLVNDQIPCNPKGEQQLKGLHKPVAIYEAETPATPSLIAQTERVQPSLPADANAFRHLRG